MTAPTRLHLKDNGDYSRSIRSIVYGFWSQRTDLFTFVDDMSLAISRGFRRAWLEGADLCGVGPAELTQEELDRLDVEINTEIQYVIAFGNRIAASQRGTGLLRAHTANIPMWANRYDAIVYLAQTYACGDLKSRWTIHPVKEHCSSCLNLDGRVYRNSVWRKYDIYPRHRELACGGFHCACTLETTDDPVTPGRPPAIP